jgi:predicted O-methyltransferase YrrM
MNHFWHEIKGWVGDTPTYRKALDRAKDGDHFVELGAYLGRSTAFMAVEIANRGLEITFDSIDNFVGIPGHEADGDIYTNCVKNLERVKDYVNIIKSDTISAAEEYEDESLDFIFVDAAHDYDSVIQDLRAWYPKLKPDGLFAGDDYSPDWPGVVKAVKQFAEEENLEIVPMIAPEFGAFHWSLRKI